MRWLDSTRARLGISAFILFTGWASDAWRNLIGWYGFGLIVLLVVAGGVLLIVRHRARFTLQSLPIPLIAFLTLATLSIAWSHYPLTSLLGVALTLMTTAAAIGVAISLSWSELLRVLGWVFRAILGLSYLFELIVATIFRAPIFPVWNMTGHDDDPSKLLYWSRNLLFDAGKIQGIVGNSSLLAMAALIGLIVFCIQVGSRSVGRVAGVTWIVVAVITVGLTRSATIFIALPILAAATLAVLLIRRVSGTRAALPTRVGLVALVTGGAIVAVLFRAPLLAAVGKSDTLTGRVGIWEAVIGLAEQRPVAGWGWLGWWTPWTPPFNTLIERGGVQVLHAHNAWLDIWVQLGVIGLVVAAALVLTTLQRSCLLANDLVRQSPSDSGHYTWLSLLPLLLLIAQLVQSAAESRILIEGGLMMLVIVAVMTKRGLQPTHPENPSFR